MSGEDIKIIEPTDSPANGGGDTGLPMSVPVLRVEKLKEEECSNYNSDSECASVGYPSDVDADIVNESVGEFTPPTDELRDKIITQVEFYFSDANILKDAFLLKHVRRNKMGYVSIKLITSFKKVKSLTKDFRVVAYSLKQSEKLEVNSEETKVRRMEPLPEWDETTPSRTVVAFNLPMTDPSIESVAELFSKHGEIALIRIIRPGKAIPSDVKKHLSKHPQLETSVCAVIEFENHESAKNAVESVDKDNWRSAIHVALLAEPKKKEKGEKKTENKKEGKNDKKKNKKKGTRIDELARDDSSCYSSGSDAEYSPLPTRKNQQRNSLSPNQDMNRLSPHSSPKSSPHTSPKSSPRPQRKNKGKSPLIDSGHSRSPKASPLTSPELGRRRCYSAGARPAGDGSDISPSSSPWVQRRLKAAQDISPLAKMQGNGGPLVNKRTEEKERILRQPRGPDGTRGFGKGRGQIINSS
ncbi:la-related protein 6 [Lingula anatina]|uniref:La-related protein 6 n=1 Tax=Lingula anatina TaxID=7574 RepID=A0A1S3K930_LINAN|nr:la-related protein 6 [Lingula anatina]|eukprot:XP_013419128.1 la-related protein 6 [Lingula anatina]